MEPSSDLVGRDVAIYAFHGALGWSKAPTAPSACSSLSIEALPVAKYRQDMLCVEYQ